MRRPSHLGGWHLQPSHPLNGMVSVLAGIAAWSVGLRQISFVLLEPPSRARGTRRSKIQQRPPLWVPDGHGARILEVFNPANEGIGVWHIET